LAVVADGGFDAGRGRTAAWSTYLHWLPCRGSMLDGTIIHPTVGDGPMIMIGFSDRDWDTPPGTGYLTVATITISATLTAIITLRTPRRGAEDISPSDRESGSLTLA
jgi:hypothetical protein